MTHKDSSEHNRAPGTFPGRSHTVNAAAFETLALAGTLIATVLVIFLDAGVLHNGLGENSITQILQGLLILASGRLFLLGTRRYPASAGYLSFLAMLFTCMFIRENDQFLDHIWHGFWVVPVAVTFVAWIAFYWSVRGTARLSFVRHFQDRSFAYLLVGLLIVLVFSRLFGTGDLWEAVMGDTYDPTVKGVVQEGLELLGYVLVFYGAVFSWRVRFLAD